MYSTKTIAEAYARALCDGFATVGEAIAWIDSTIEAEDQPHWSLIDASLAGRDRAALITALHDVPGEADPQSVACLFIGHMSRAVRNDPSRSQDGARRLFRMAMDDDLPAPSAAGAMWSFDDDLDLATSGVHGDPEQIRSQLRDFLAEYGDVL